MLAMMVCIFASCSDGGGEEPSTPTPKPEEVKTEITIDSGIISNGLSFDSTGGEQSVSFSVNADWTLSIASTTSGATWCKASVTSGSKGTTNVKFTVSENTDYEDRSVSVTIKARTVSKTFTITQKGADAMLVTTTKYEVAQEGGQIEIEVKANIDYRMEISDEAKNWIKESSSRALTTYKHKLDIAMNEDKEKREGEITFKNGDKVESVKVYQAGGAILLLSQNEYTVSDAGETISVDIKSNIDFGVQMPNVDWIIDEASSRGLSSHTLKYAIKANEGYDSRSAEIVFYDKNSDLKDTLKVVQAQKDAIILSQKEIFVGAKADTIEVKLNANVEFEMEIPNVDWISHITSRSLKEHCAIFYVQNNDTEERRNANVLFYGKNKLVCDTIAIIQKSKEEFIPYLTFTANAPQLFTMSKAVSTLEYSVNGSEWNELGTKSVLFGGGNGNLRLRGKSRKGTANSPFDCSNIEFGNESLVNCHGDIRTLIDYMDYDNVATNNAKFCFLFANCDVLITAPDLPTMSLAEACYDMMFLSCTRLISAPKLPAKFLSYGCYYQMFDGCTSLTSAPELPATNLAESCYSGMFDGCTSLVSAPELPATNLAESCYSYMFKGCTSLTSAPELPATMLAKSCYFNMFYGCSSLTTAPELPATALAKNCYTFMFTDCSNLTSAPELPAMTLAESCYSGMFNGCTSLTSAPELPATTLTKYCYSFMFEGCTSLTSALKLPATNLAAGCYESMFRGCTMLTSAPELPATTLTKYCYLGMFKGCSSLTSAPELLATNLATGCYDSMFRECTMLTSAPELPATNLAEYCYSGMFNGCTSLLSAPELPATNLAAACYDKMFYKCGKIKNITMLAIDISAKNCLNSWLYGVSSTGTFTKAKEMTSLPVGNNGIPKGWTIKNNGEE